MLLPMRSVAGLRAPKTSRLRRLAPAAIAATVLITGCGSDGEGSEIEQTAATSDDCEVPTDPATVEGPLADFDLSGVATATSSGEEGGYFVVEALSEDDIPSLTTKFLAIVEAAGYDPAGTDDEGFEAEVFFARGNVAAGQVVLEDSEECDGLVEIKITLLDDPSVLSSDAS